MVARSILGDEVHPCVQQMTDLCNSFPCLRGKPGTSPWDQYDFALAMSGGGPTPATRLAAAFVLSVWNGGTPRDRGWWNKRPYRVGVFDPVEAMARWDYQQREAFLAWCENPFYP